MYMCVCVYVCVRVSVSVSMSMSMSECVWGGLGGSSRYVWIYTHKPSSARSMYPYWGGVRSELLLLIQGSGRVRVGTWGCALCINVGLDEGSSPPPSGQPPPPPPPHYRPLCVHISEGCCGSIEELAEHVTRRSRRPIVR